MLYAFPKVEKLLSKFHARVESRLAKDTSDLKNSRLKGQEKPPSPSPGTYSLGGLLPHARVSDDEEVCPICLLEMVEGESLTSCKDGCNNRLHQHCMEICEFIISYGYCMEHWLDMRWQVANEAGIVELAMNISYLTSTSGVIDLLKTIKKFC